MKWGIGVDNVDFAACKRPGHPDHQHAADVRRRGGRRGRWASVIGLAREMFQIDRGVRAGGWPKPAGISLAVDASAWWAWATSACAVCARMQAWGWRWSPTIPASPAMPGIAGLQRAAWPERIETLDFLVFTCALNAHNHHMLNADVLTQCATASASSTSRAAH